jgi:thiosulfate dehydrogenase (quinone) large subunit
LNRQEGIKNTISYYMENNLSKGQLTWLVILRIFIGWHFLYEGLVKVLNPNWTASAYLIDSKGWFSNMFVNMAGNPGLMRFIDFLNEWALVVIGLGLLLGFFSRFSCIGGILLLLLYTMSHPALIGVEYKLPFEGSYFLIDKNLVELAALGVLFVFPSARVIGFDRFLCKVLPAGFRKFLI